MKAVQWISFICTAVDLAALLAHVLELPNKLTLVGPLWLAVQQQLYRGWGPVLGPFEVFAVLSAWALVVARRHRRSFGLTLAAALCLTAMFVLFFALVQPVNIAFAAWTPETLPPDWPRYRLRWEIGHAVRALLGLFALAALIRAAIADARS
jgi:hypothetical protein